MEILKILSSLNSVCTPQKCIHQEQFVMKKNRLLTPVLVAVLFSAGSIVLPILSEPVFAQDRQICFRGNNNNGGPANGDAGRSDCEVNGDSGDGSQDEGLGPTQATGNLTTGGVRLITEGGNFQTDGGAIGTRGGSLFLGTEDEKGDIVRAGNVDAETGEFSGTLQVEDTTTTNGLTSNGDTSLISTNGNSQLIVSDAGITSTVSSPEVEEPMAEVLALAPVEPEVEPQEPPLDEGGETSSSISQTSDSVSVTVTNESGSTRGLNVGTESTIVSGGSTSSQTVTDNAGFTVQDIDGPTDTADLFSISNPGCLLYTSPSPRDGATSRMPSSA